jgi:hypothetical protein
VCVGGERVLQGRGEEQVRFCTPGCMLCTKQSCAPMDVHVRWLLLLLLLL